MPAWQGFGIQARADALEKIGLEILGRKDELGALLAREEGKTRWVRTSRPKTHAETEA